MNGPSDQEERCIVLLHGFLIDARSNWVDNGALALSSTRFRAVAMDVRGHGASSKPHDPSEYGPEVVRDVVRLMDHLGVERANLVGYSMGGQIALRVVTSFPDRIERAVIGGAGWLEEGSEDYEQYVDWTATVPTPPPALEQGRRGDGVPRRLPR